jgi:glycosyltransferase involved in cell wall biosynthesis
MAVRILNVAQTYYPYLAEGGRPAKVRVLSRKLAERGHDVTVLTANLGIADWSRIGLPIEKTTMGWRLTEGGVVAIYLPTWFRYRTLTINPGVFRFCGAALRKFDLVHFYGLYDLLGPSVSYYCRHHGIPYVVEPMGMYRPIDRSILLKGVWHRSIGTAFWRNASKVIATSELEQLDLVDHGVPREQVVVRYNGIDAGVPATAFARSSFRAKWRIPKGEPLIFFLSRLIPRKGADILIQAFAEACPVSGRLVIAGPDGEPGYGSYLKKCAEQSGAAARIIFTGPLYNEEKTAAFAEADVFALPSRYENFANVAAESIACGVPVIITPYCGIHTLVETGSAGLIVTPEKRPLTEAIYRMTHDEGLVSRLREGCRTVTERLSWDHLAAEMERYYAEAMTGENGVR